MSKLPKARRRRNLPKSQTRPGSAAAGDRALLAACIAAIILAGMPFALGKYIEFNSPGAFDSGAYVYSAWAVLDGAVIGVDQMPSAQLGTLLVNMLGVRIFGFSETGPEIIQMLMQGSALVVLFLTMLKVFGKAAAVVAVFVASFYLSAPLIAKYGNVKEQYMIAVMILGVCSYIHSQRGGSKWFAALAGALLVWAPLFKPTGISAAAAVGVFALAGPVLGHKSVKEMGKEVGLLLGGAAVSLGPAVVWLLVRHEGNFLPYAWLWRMIAPAESRVGGYVSDAHAAISFEVMAWRILRYYWLLMLPIALALAAIGVRLWRLAGSWRSEGGFKRYGFDKFVLLLGIWWVLDMAFIWISPRSFEEYYLPLNASAAMLGGYAVAVFMINYHKSVSKRAIYGWSGAGCVVLMAVLSWHIFFGISSSPHSGQAYPEGRRRGYVQALAQAKEHAGGARAGWELAGEFIGRHSGQDDTIYVWGWYPGIYVRAGRLSSTNRAFTSEMHVMSPEALGEYVQERLADFAQQMPAFLVDTQKSEFPWDRPALQLWPVTGEGLLANNAVMVGQYERQYRSMLAEQVGEDEARRFDAMKPFRDFVMENYEFARNFGPIIVFRLKR